MSAIRFCALLLTMSLLAACATSPVKPVPVDVRKHQAKLAAMQVWTLSGRLAFKSPEEKFSVNVNWQQEFEHSEVNFTSFLGTNVLHMTVTPENSVLTLDEEQYVDTDPSSLIARTTGWNIPMNNLPLWIKGQFTPQDRFTFDENGLLNQLTPLCNNCGYWNVTYSRYKKVTDMWLPHQIDLVNQFQPDNKIKIRINQWIPQTSGGQAPQS